MRRWMVYKDPEDRWLRWIAAPAHENWWEKPQGIRFPQWGMAMRYADRMALTAKPETIGNQISFERLSRSLQTLGFKLDT